MPMAVALMTITGSCIANCGSFQFRHKAVFKSVRGSRNKGEKKIAIALMASQVLMWLFRADILSCLCRCGCLSEHTLRNRIDVALSVNTLEEHSLLSIVLLAGEVVKISSTLQQPV